MSINEAIIQVLVANIHGRLKVLDVSQCPPHVDTSSLVVKIEQMHMETAAIATVRVHATMGVYVNETFSHCSLLLKTVEIIDHCYVDQEHWDRFCDGKLTYGLEEDQSDSTWVSPELTSSLVGLGPDIMPVLRRQSGDGRSPT
jgi:hypothetical protein